MIKHYFVQIMDVGWKSHQKRKIYCLIKLKISLCVLRKKLLVLTYFRAVVVAVDVVVVDDVDVVVASVKRNLINPTISLSSSCTSFFNVHDWWVKKRLISLYNVQVWISSTFYMYVHIFRTKDIFLPKRNKRKALSYEKRSSKMLMKLTAGG